MVEIDDYDLKKNNSFVTFRRFCHGEVSSCTRGIKEEKKAYRDIRSSISILENGLGYMEIIF